MDVGECPCECDCPGACEQPARPARGAPTAVAGPAAVMARGGCRGRRRPAYRNRLPPTAFAHAWLGSAQGTHCAPVLGKVPLDRLVSKCRVGCPRRTFASASAAAISCISTSPPASPLHRSHRRPPQRARCIHYPVRPAPRECRPGLLDGQFIAIGCIPRTTLVSSATPPQWTVHDPLAHNGAAVAARNGDLTSRIARERRAAAHERHDQVQPQF